jgi:hypothetical protein
MTPGVHDRAAPRPYARPPARQAGSTGSGSAAGRQARRPPLHPHTVCALATSALKALHAVESKICTCLDRLGT